MPTELHALNDVWGPKEECMYVHEAYTFINSDPQITNVSVWWRQITQKLGRGHSTIQEGNLRPIGGV